MYFTSVLVYLFLVYNHKIIFFFIEIVYCSLFYSRFCSWFLKIKIRFETEFSVILYVQLIIYYNTSMRKILEVELIILLQVVSDS